VEAAPSGGIGIGRIDILVNNAGIGGFGGRCISCRQTPGSRFSHQSAAFSIPFVPSHSPDDQKRVGHIINISSLPEDALPTERVTPPQVGLNGLTYSVAEELRRTGPRQCDLSRLGQYELRPHTGKDPMKMLQPEERAHTVAMLVTQAPQSFVSEILPPRRNRDLGNQPSLPRSCHEDNLTSMVNFRIAEYVLQHRSERERPPPEVILAIS